EEKYYELYPDNITTTVNSRTVTFGVLNFVFYPKFSFQTTGKCALVIGIDGGYLHKIISSISGETNISTMVIDSEGTVLSHTDSGCFLQDFSDKSYVKRILNNDDTYVGTFTENIDGKKYL